MQTPLARSHSKWSFYSFSTSVLSIGTHFHSFVTKTHFLTLFNLSTRFSNLLTRFYFHQNVFLSSSTPPPPLIDTILLITTAIVVLGASISPLPLRAEERSFTLLHRVLGIFISKFVSNGPSLSYFLLNFQTILSLSVGTVPDMVLPFYLWYFTTHYNYNYKDSTRFFLRNIFLFQLKFHFVCAV